GKLCAPGCCSLLFAVLYRVHTGEVVGDVGQGELVSDFFFSSGAELAHAALLFQHSEARLDEGLTLGIGLPSRRTSQLLAHTPVRRRPCLTLASFSQVQRPRHIRVGQTGVYLLLLQP